MSLHVLNESYFSSATHELSSINPGKIVLANLLRQPITLLQSGGEYFNVLFSMLANAKKTICIETYILANDDIGLQCVELLKQASRRGVTVRIIIDWHGTHHRICAMWKKHFISNGIHFQFFNPFFRRGWTRSHRKLVIIDADTPYGLGFIGGINLKNDFNQGEGKPPLTAPRWDFAACLTGERVRLMSDSFETQWHGSNPIEKGRSQWRYLSSKFREQSDDLINDLALTWRQGLLDSTVEKPQKFLKWKIRLRPPQQNNNAFLGDSSDTIQTTDLASAPTSISASQTTANKNTTLSQHYSQIQSLQVVSKNISQLLPRQWRQKLSRRFPPLTHTSSGSTIKLISRDNFKNRNSIQKAYLRAIRSAQNSILLVTPYFAPGRKFRMALIRAAKRGVDVNLVIGVGEINFQDKVTHAFYPMLLKSGVKILEFREPLLHAKVAVIDEVWSTLGSSNCDALSLLINKEINIVVNDATFAQVLTQKIKPWLKLTTIVNYEDFIALSVWQRINYRLTYVVYRFIMRIATWGSYP